MCKKYFVSHKIFRFGFFDLSPLVLTFLTFKCAASECCQVNVLSTSGLQDFHWWLWELYPRILCLSGTVDCVLTKKRPGNKGKDDSLVSLFLELHAVSVASLHMEEGHLSCK